MRTLNHHGLPLLIAAFSLLFVGCSRKSTPAQQENISPEREVVLAIEAGDLETVMKWVPSIVAVDTMIGTGGHPTGDTALALALWEANKVPSATPQLQIIEYLVANGADVNLPNKYGRTRLHFPHNLKVIRLLLNSGARVDVPSTDDRMAHLLRAGLEELPGITFAHATEANGVFVQMPEAAILRLRDIGWRFYTFIGHGFARFMCSWKTRPADIEALLHDIRASL